MSVSSRSDVPSAIAGGNQTFDPSLMEGFVTDPLASWANADPNRVAIVARGVSLTYSELERRTNRIARSLRKLGVGNGDRVAFVLNRGVRTIQLVMGILKSGAAYVPLDATSPLVRIKDCIEDARPTLVIIEDTRSIPEIDTPGFSFTTLEAVLAEAERESDEPIGPADFGITGDDLAYIIFTSGSTGRPKGVPITHKSLQNFVRGNQIDCICVDPADVVFQGYSPASDGHHEEIWPTLLVGATLAVASAKEVYSGSDLAAFLNDFAVTVISCAPTLLSMVEVDIPTIRRILFGAESLPPALVKKWWSPSRVILNTYGPTEATVGATFGECVPDKPVTIGRALPNYWCYILDDSLVSAAPGGEGELCITGVGVSSGYYGRADLSSTKFVANPYSIPGRHDETLYRTGDRARIDAEGNIVWLGRIDSQIKIRGHRVELSEIESAISSCAGVNAGVVVVRQSESGDTMLAALLVISKGAAFEIGDLLERLRDTLPPHMVPTVIEQVERIPRLPSGKVDRAACALLHGSVFRLEREIVPPRTDNERLVIESWRELFGHQEVSATDDFFRDLGGYSLLASRFISKLRSDRLFSRVSVLDLYENPSVRGFAAQLDSQVAVERTTPDFKPVPPGRYVMAKVWQAIGLLFIFGIHGFFWLGPIIAAIYLSAERGHHDLVALALGVVLHAVSVPVMLALVVALKWLIIGRFKEGSYPLWGSMYLRWWFVTRLLGVAPVTHMTGTPLAAAYLRCLGAKVGRNVFLESLEIDCPDLVEIGNDCSLENSAWIHVAEVAYGELHMRRVRIADGCTIGVRSGLSGGAAMEQGASLRDLTCVRTGVTVPRDEEWIGSVARRAEHSTLPKYDPTKQPSIGRLAGFTTVQCLLVGVLAMLESVPFVTVAFTLYNWSEGFTAYLWEPVYAIALVVLAAVQTLIVKWLVLGRLKEGVYPFPGVLWVRKWFTDKHLELASGGIVPIYDSLFARPWCIALGMKCGPRCEIALPRRMPYDLVSMGEESFLASEVSIGRPVRRNGELILEQTHIGNRAFLGNDSVVPQGCSVPDDFLLGVLSVCPSNEQIGASEEQAWLGSPPFRMPNRQVMDTFDPTQTYRPTRSLYAQRLVHEAARVILPGLCSLIIASILIEGFVSVWNQHSLELALATVPVLYLLGVLIGALMCRISKAVFIGTYRPTIQPLWSQFVWKTETHSAILHDFAAPLFISDLEGTPFINSFMRFMGSRVGSRVFMNTTDWTETDLVTVGDDAAINANAPLQAHLFEDRVMKVGPIHIGDRCSVGNYSVILCESELKNDAHVGHLSLVMKGETIPSHTFWAGSPAQACDDIDLDKQPPEALQNTV